MPGGPELRVIDAEEFRAELDALVSIYAAAMNAPLLALPGRRATMEHHTGLTAFRAVVVTLPAPAAPGTSAPPVIAFAYGFHGTPGQWWHDLVTSALAAAAGDGAARAWMSDPFEIAEVHVRPDYQHRGIGRRMLLRLVDGRPESTAVLSTMDDDTTARRLYRRLGFTDLVTGYRFGGTEPPYAVMGAALPLHPEPAPGR